LKEGWIDYVTPQLYWNIGFKVADYSALLDWWSKHSYGKHVYIGQGIYRVGGKGWENTDEIVNQINLNRNYTEVKGSMYFNSKTFLENKLGVNEKLQSVYRHPALIPPMSWIDAIAPLAPVVKSAGGSQADGVEISWSDSTRSDAAYYVIYRFEKGNLVSSDNPANIVAIVAREPLAIQSWTDKKTRKRTAYAYRISAVDHGHNESGLSSLISIKTRGKRGAVKIVSARP
jgi:hypothetical protein